jgi:DNA adenine methylase
MLNAPICWLGGKHRLRGELIRLLPEHTCYVEVFGGAGWVLFGKEQSKVEVYNDIDGELSNFFRIVKGARKAFVQAFDLILVSRRLFRDFLDTRAEDLDEVQRAVRFYYLIKCSFGGKWANPTFGYAKTGKPTLNLETLYETITAVHSRLRRVWIEEGSFEEVIERYDGPDTVFYCDPPYYETAGYRYGMELEDYQCLAKMLGAIEGRFLLTINDHPEMRKVFGGFRIEEVEVSYSVARKTEARRKFGEMVVRNFG